ncbi:hydroxyacid dehydrogenase [Leifsonia sp. ZF2019]|uniref:hydroxyacid dehydrogenase n=1 Tax=Leifsonia sp. ZF2019 TaxID=2781978 RepID=UPI001CC19F1D|nr:hydroxyacid dehydrogenase [Leifsonia sp. ZF2019]UAJ81057.1 hydroxyacid dehydrogenase [Leifsonia sp. ZF2019]
MSDGVPADAAASTSRPVLLVAVPVARRAEFFDAGDAGRLADAAARLGGELVFAESLADAAAEVDLAAVRVLVVSWGVPALDAARLDTLPRLELVAHCGASIRPFATPELFRRGVLVTQAGAAMARSVAEVSLAFTLALLHRIPRFDHALHAGSEWTEAEAAPPQHELLDAPIGVVGASRTGRAYLELLVALGARPLLADPTVDAAEARRLGAALVPLDVLLANSRIVALHAPSLPETHRMIGARELALMPTGAGLVNTARSWLVDEDALLAELGSGRIDAALDVFDDEPLPVDSPFRALPNALLVPHKAAGTREGRLRQGAVVVSEVARHAAGRPLEHVVTEQDLERMA